MEPFSDPSCWCLELSAQVLVQIASILYVGFLLLRVAAKVGVVLSGPKIVQRREKLQAYPSWTIFACGNLALEMNRNSPRRQSKNREEDLCLVRPAGERHPVDHISTERGHAHEFIRATATAYAADICAIQVIQRHPNPSTCPCFGLHSWYITIHIPRSGHRLRG